MQEKQILNHAKHAMDDLAPDCFDAIWEKVSQANTEDFPLPNTITHTSTKNKRRTLAWISSLTAMAACLLVFFGFTWYQRVSIYSTINLDVNPSICICANRKQEVLSVSGLNEDGKAVLETLPDFTHRSLDEVVTETIEEIVNEGYLTVTEENTVLVSVDVDNPRDAEHLMAQLSSRISGIIDEQNLPGKVISQEMSKDDEKVNQLAKDLHISEGKATLIQSMTEENKDLSKEALADMRINEIIRTAKDEHMDISKFEKPAKETVIAPPKCSTTPTASATPKITTEEPKSTAQPTNEESYKAHHSYDWCDPYELMWGWGYSFGYGYGYGYEYNYGHYFNSGHYKSNAVATVAPKPTKSPKPTVTPTATNVPKSNDTNKDNRKDNSDDNKHESSPKNKTKATEAPTHTVVPTEATATPEPTSEPTSEPYEEPHEPDDHNGPGHGGPPYSNPYDGWYGYPFFPYH